MENSPDDFTTLRCTDDNGFNILITDGIAYFTGLFVNEAGTHHSLHFSTDLVLEGGNSEVISNEFSVGIGPATEILLIHDAASDGTTVLGGHAFAPQLRAEVHDAGGNILVNDSSSAIRVSFYSNPSSGTFSIESATMEVLKGGIVQFRSLSIDKAGIGYRLTYDFLHHDGAQLTETSVFTYGSYFNVEVGPPNRLSILQYSSGGWAGNQPFQIQPIVALVDAGGNIVIEDSTSVVTAHVTPSLAHNSRVIIDTSNDAIPTITEVRFAENIKNDTRLTYGPGDMIQIDVVFSQEVTIFQTINDGTLPQIILNTINTGDVSEAVYAELMPPSQEGLFSRIVSFVYSVDIGHYSQTELEYMSSSSLHEINDYSIEDAFGRSANLMLPIVGDGSSLSASKVIGISDAQPKIESITADLPTGGYGVGEEIVFVVIFDRDVVVVGTPELPLNIQFCDVNTCTARAATYVNGSGTNSLTFNYTVLPGDDIERLGISEDMGIELQFPSSNDSIYLHVNSLETSPVQVDASIAGFNLPPELHISIDTSPPAITSIVPQASTTQSGGYAVGDTLYFEISFDKAVEVSRPFLLVNFSLSQASHVNIHSSV